MQLVPRIYFASALMALMCLTIGGFAMIAVEDHRGRLLATTAAGLLAGSAITGLVVARRVIRPLRAVAVSMDRLARGDLDAPIPRAGAGEIGAMVKALRRFRDEGVEGRRRLEALRDEERRARQRLLSGMLTLTEVLESEIQETVEDISSQTMRLTDGANKLSRVAGSLHEAAQAMGESIETTAGNVQTVASATAELEASSQEILTQVANSARLADEARRRAEQASTKVSGLTESAASIGDVVGMIRAIAEQTNLLALNANIEAARAGEAGKGFAVVAGEVKGLARQTEDGIASVSAQADDIGRTTREAAETVGAVTAAIREIDAIGSEVARAAGDQQAATGEIMASAAQAADHTGMVAERMRSMLGGVDTTAGTAQRVNDLAAMVNRDIVSLQRRLCGLLRASMEGEGRDVAERVSTALHFVAEFDGRRHEGYTGNISTRGALLVFASKDHPREGTGMLTLDGLPPLKAQFLTDSAIGIHVRFLDLDDEATGRLAGRIAHANDADQAFIALAQDVAAQARSAAEAALRDGRIDEDALFSIDYEPIPGTDPQQYLAPHTDLAEREFRPLIEPPLQRDQRVVFCCIIDRAGYIAAHNVIYSQPQKPDDPLWNAANCRNRRIFDDRAGLLAARNTREFLSQTYPRDMGGGKFILLKEIDAPITISGRHWGSVRLALKLT